MKKWYWDKIAKDNAGIQPYAVFDENDFYVARKLNKNDARLIASAPELLNALKRAREFILDGQDNEGYPILPDEIDEALNKAEGK